jgi:hypothetical protein
VSILIYNLYFSDSKWNSHELSKFFLFLEISNWQVKFFLADTVSSRSLWLVGLGPDQLPHRHGPVKLWLVLACRRRSPETAIQGSRRRIGACIRIREVSRTKWWWCRHPKVIGASPAIAHDGGELRSIHSCELRMPIQRNKSSRGCANSPGCRLCARRWTIWSEMTAWWAFSSDSGKRKVSNSQYSLLSYWIPSSWMIPWTHRSPWDTLWSRRWLETATSGGTPACIFGWWRR